MVAVVTNINYRLWQPWLMKRLIKKIDMDSHYLLGLFWNILVDIHHSILSPSILFNNQRQIIEFCSVLALSLPENESSIIELRIKHSKLVFPGWSWFDLVWFGLIGLMTWLILHSWALKCSLNQRWLCWRPSTSIVGMKLAHGLRFSSAHMTTCELWVSFLIKDHLSACVRSPALLSSSLPSSPCKGEED